MWISLGTMMKLIYDQFSGVQVIEVLNDHIILTFCIHQPRSQFFSIILTRNPNSISVDVRFFFRRHFSLLLNTQLMQDNFKCFSIILGIAEVALFT